ncbi:MAG: hypothetical protein KatS3mg131_3003 [Candidatus Tectimicrobiota bacterium]|nr:MAG: hypothetical protein KatS3mg131_3003 [Candidatus Tectomicrobia bacterium]
MSTRSVAVSPRRQLAGEPHPHHLRGTSMYTGWPSITASASMPPTPQPSTPSPLIMVVWESVPTSVSGTPPRRLLRATTPGQVLQVHLVHDARGRGHHPEVGEGLLAPLQELVALAVALELRSALKANASPVPKRSTCTEWSMTRSTGIRGLMRLGSPPSRAMAERMAARSTTAGTPGEVLQEHPRRLVRDLALLPGRPGRHPRQLRRRRPR